jgi:hypothetical protein
MNMSQKLILSLLVLGSQVSFANQEQESPAIRTLMSPINTIIEHGYADRIVSYAIDRRGNVRVDTRYNNSNRENLNFTIPQNQIQRSVQALRQGLNIPVQPAEHEADNIILQPVQLQRQLAESAGNDSQNSSRSASPVQSNNQDFRNNNNNRQR